MSRPNADRFERLLRWYPRAWRAVHGAVFVDTLRDQSEDEGRTSPSSGETFAAVVTGLGTRLDARLAIRLALAAIALTAVPTGIVTMGAIQGRTTALWDILIAAGSGTTALLTLTSIVALGRALGLVPAGRAIGVLALAWPACALASFAQYGWVVRFDAADADVDVSGPGVYQVVPAGPVAASATVAAFAGGVLAAAAIWLLVDAVLVRTRLGRVPRLGLATAAGTGAGLAAVVAVVFPMGWVAVALGVVGGAIGSLGTWSSPEPRTVPAQGTVGPLVRTLAGASALAGFLGIVYALTATAWSPAASDATLAWAQGIVILLCAALPLVVAMGFSVIGHGRDARNVWGPALLVGATIGTVIYAYSDSPDSQRLEPALIMGSASLGVAAAWWVLSRFEAPRVDKAVAGVAIALGSVAFQGAYLLPLVVFVTPALAAILCVRGDLSPRRSRPRVPANTPVADA